MNFDDNWNTSHIDDKQKILLLLKKFKFTSTLENILENEVNLNVLIDNTTNHGLICNNNKFEKMNIKDIVNKTMKKLLDSLNNFKNEICERNENNLDLCIIENEMNKANIKYEDFKKNKNSQNNVNDIIKNIYNKKKDNTYNICKLSGY
jgi:predicted CopG family antitoxin